ncbi:MAG: rod shape-determining protein MreC [Bdellovibrionota bacterium]|nr:MAG: rod shape-determining protein MreC [Bdellovibrionota bacterium]
MSPTTKAFVEKGRKAAGTALALFLLSTLLSAYTAKRPHIAGSLSGAFTEVLYPLLSSISSLRGGVGGIWDGYIALRGVKEENHELRRRLEVLEAQNSRLLELRHENDRLRGLLKVGEETQLSGVVADVIGYEASNWVQAITLNRGSADGVWVGTAAVDQEGLVGRVIAVSPSTSKVLLITDPTSGVDAIAQDTRAHGVVEGNGSTLCRWRFVLNDDEVKIGDRIITSGMDGLFPKGLLVGVVSAIEPGDGLFQSVDVRPAVRLPHLESVLLLTGAQRPKDILADQGGRAP